MSKALGISNNISNTADAIIYTVDTSVPVIANKNPIGAVSIDQIAKGFSNPSVQSAIEDIAAVSIQDIGTIVTNVTGTSPAGLQQTTRATFSGVVVIADPLSSDPITSTSSRIVEFLGIPITLIQGEDSDAIATKFSTALQVYATNSIGVDSVEQNQTTPSIIDFEHSDYNNHNYATEYNNGITVTYTVLSPAKYGYGNWLQIGQEDKTLGSSTVTFHYFQRES